MPELNGTEFSLFGFILALVGAVTTIYRGIAAGNEKLRKELHERMDREEESNSECRDADRTTLQNAVEKLHTEIKQIERLAVRRDELAQSESRHEARISRMDAKVDRIEERLGGLPAIEATGRQNAELLGRIINLLEGRGRHA